MALFTSSTELPSPTQVVLKPNSFLSESEEIWYYSELLLLLLGRFSRPSTLSQLLYHKERERDFYFIVTQCDRLSLI